MSAVDDNDPSAGQAPLPAEEKTPFQKGLDELTIALAASTYRKFRVEELRKPPTPKVTPRE